MSKEELFAYRDWFHSVMAERTEQLSRLVAGTHAFSAWKPDLTPESLSDLGEWFRGEAESRSRTAAVDIPVEELTDRTLSLVYDIGMYFGRVVVASVPGTHWDQPIRNKRFADYGHPVIMGFGRVPMNPVRIAKTLAYAFAAHEESGDGLRKVFDVWNEMRDAKG